jgi:hypothetical protein
VGLGDSGNKGQVEINSTETEKAVWMVTQE